MCGIKTILYCCGKCKLLYDFDDSYSFYNMKNRGPDSVSVINQGILFMGIHRLSFINTKEKLQPYADNNNFFVCNGEIYNYKKIDENEKEDCKVIYNFLSKEENRSTFMIKKFLSNRVNGEYAFVFYDAKIRQLIIARDEYGVRPLYCGFKKCCYEKNKFTFIFSSEIKSMNDEGLLNVGHFPPGTFLLNNELHIFKNTYAPFFHNVFYKAEKQLLLKETLIEAVSKRVLHFDESSDSKIFGCLLSGGVDSSLVTAISFNILKEKFGLEYARENLYAFSIYYTEDNADKEKFTEDVKKAIEVKKFLGIKHHYIASFNFDNIKDNLNDVIKQIETYDITTIRASLPQYLLAKVIKEYFPKIKFIMTGEGADELFGGYKYLKGIYKTPLQEINTNTLEEKSFKKEPDHYAKNIFHGECEKLLDEIHFFDGLRTDRTMSRFSLEVRVPFLDKNFSTFVRKYLTTSDKICTEKTEKDILREAFKGYIPDSILFRPKEAFSDSINCEEKNWFNILFKDIDHEKKFYKYVFNKHYKFNIFKNIIPHYWMPSPVFTNGLQVKDPSAKIL